MTERLLDYCPETGERQWFSTDTDGNSFIRYEQDVSRTLDDNKSSQADGFDKRSEFWHAAKIPNVVIMEWFTKYGVKFWDPDHKSAWIKLLNSSEYRHLRRHNFVI